MREIHVSLIEQSVCDLCIEANRYLTDDVKNAVCNAEKQEVNPLPKEIMRDLAENFKAAEKLGLPVCQDTGMAGVFA